VCNAFLPIEGSTRVSKINGFNLSVSDAPGSRLDKQVRDVKRFLGRHQSELKLLTRLNLHSVIDFGVHTVGDSGVAYYRFDLNLLVALTKVGVGLDVSHYGSPPDNDG
jgi:hypothetical protein